MVGRARYNPWLFTTDLQIGHLIKFAKCCPCWANKAFCDPILSIGHV
jgi:hypothetical protein